MGLSKPDLALERTRVAEILIFCTDGDYKVNYAENENEESMLFSEIEL